MPKLQRTLVFNDPALGIDIELVVGTADYGHALLRTSLHETNVRIAAAAMAAAAIAENKAGYILAQRDATLSAYLYPSMIAAVLEAKKFEGLCANWPPTLEEFAAMPEEFGIIWEVASFATNPQWVPEKVQPVKEAAGEQDPKKSNGSQGS